MDDVPAGKIVRAEVPLAEMFGYATDSAFSTQGRATYAWNLRNMLKHHEVVTHDLEVLVNNYFNI